jgi:hypothetical protein
MWAGAYCLNCDATLRVVTLWVMIKSDNYDLARRLCPHKRHTGLPRGHTFEVSVIPAQAGILVNEA